MKYKYGLVFILILFFGCAKDRSSGTSGEAGSGQDQDVPELNLTIDTGSFTVDAKDLIEIDLSQDLEGKSLEELRILRNSLYARQGYLFMRADLRGYFSQTEWYPKLMNKRYWAEERGQSVVPIQFNPDEKKFIARVNKLEKEKLNENYFDQHGRKLANVNNIINKFQFKNIDKEFLTALARNGFVITPNDNIQFFHLYEQNDYQQVPNFVTTDMYLQLYHMYFSYCLRNAEREFFFIRMGKVSRTLAEKSYNNLKNEGSQELQNAAVFNTVFFGVACKLFGQSFNTDNPGISKLINEEYGKVMRGQDALSPYLGYPNIEFPYSLFKPRGHYTRSDTLKNYFRGMMWLQKAEMCLDESVSFNRAMYMADLLRSSGPVYQQFLSVFEPVKYVIGEPDNISVVDIVNELKQQGIAKSEIFNPAVQADIRKRLLNLDRNKIRPRKEISCRNKINLMPQRYLFDNEILLSLVDVDNNQSKRAYPKGIDIFGAMGVLQARELLFEFYDEDENWEEYRPAFDRLQAAHADLSNKEKTVYNQWMECLQTMQQSRDEYPYFMQTRGWQKKNLNTALASWAELKHDAILYSEQPTAAECGDGGPPPPITVGYVEPNVAFWTKMIELIESTRRVFEENNILVGGVKKNTEQFLESAKFLLQVSKKEINGERLSDREYQTIEYIGSSVEYMTIGLLDGWVHNWDFVKGPDKSVAVVADIFTSNAQNNPNKGILHVATGYVNDIYVVVEIEGYLYLTRGAVFSYYEFNEPLNSRLTDEEWQKRLERKEAPPILPWMNDIIYDKKPPEPNEGIFYSSGC